MKTIYIALFSLCFSHFATAQSAEETKNINAYFSNYFKAACTEKLHEKTLALTSTQAPQLEMTLGKTDKIGLTFGNTNKTEKVFQQLAITEWDQKFIVGVKGAKHLQINKADVLLKGVKNTFCEDRGLSMYHFNTHEWGSYLLEIADASDRVELVIIPTTQ